MNYYLIPIESLRTFNPQINNFLKTMYPQIYNLYKRNYTVDKLVLGALRNKNLPTHVLFLSKQILPKKEIKVIEPITEIELKLPMFYCLAHKISRQKALFYLRNLSENEIESIAISFYKFINEKRETKSKIIMFPSKKLF